MRRSEARKEEANPKILVIERLLGMAKIIRKQGSPDEAMAAAEYEKQFEADLQKLKAA